MISNQSLAEWMAYAVCLSAMLGLLAIAAEDTVRRTRVPVRALWGAALSAALLLPVLVWAFSRAPVAGAPDVVQVTPAAPSVSPAAIGSAAAIAARATPTIWERLATWRDTARIHGLARLDGAARLIVIGSPLVCALWLAAAWLSLRARRRAWHEGTVDETAVLISSDFGPAIVGVRHPRIVVPEWAMSLTASERRLMIAHERQHLAAQDGRAVTLALCSLALMPWNVALWPMVRRFRLAVELDCDARLLRATEDVRQYGGLLLEVARHTPAGSAMVAALVERPSALRRRIEAMTARGRASRARVTRDLSGFTLAIAAFCMISPPRPEMAPAQPRTVSHLSAPEASVTRVVSRVQQADTTRVVRGAGVDSTVAQTTAARPLQQVDGSGQITPASSGSVVHDAQSPSGSSDILRGTVTAEDGTPLVGVQVTAIDQVDSVRISSRTNADGRYTLFVANGHGDYIMTFSADGYDLVTAPLKRLLDEDVLVANVVMIKHGASSADAQVMGGSPPLQVPQIPYIARKALPAEPGSAVRHPPEPGASDIVRGLITGPDSAPIANAAVSAMNQATNTMTRTHTNTAGRYILFIANGDGDYLMTITAAGFNDTTVVARRDSTEGVLVANVQMNKSKPAPAPATGAGGGLLEMREVFGWRRR